MLNAVNRIELNETISFILDNIDNSRIVLKRVASIRDKLIGLTLSRVISEQDFYRISSVLTPQSRSPMWQNYFIEKYNCEKVSKNEDRGDLKKNGVYYEYKASGYNLGNSVNIVQIRPWQDCDYIVQAISDDGATTFFLTHKEMMLEMDELNASVAHGTKTVVSDNTKIEYRMTLNIGSDDWDRWVKNYQRYHDIFH